MLLGNIRTTGRSRGGENVWDTGAVIKHVRVFPFHSAQVSHNGWKIQFMIVFSFSMFTLLAAILHLGNVTFKKVSTLLLHAYTCDYGFEFYTFIVISHRRIMKMLSLLLTLTP